MNQRNISMSQLLKESEDADFHEHVSEARSRKLTVAQIREQLKKMMRSKVWWLNRYSDGRGKRPDNEIETQKRHLSALVQADDLLKGGGDGTGRGG